MGDEGTGVETLIRKNIGVLRGKLGSAISAGQSNEGFFGLIWGR